MKFFRLVLATIIFLISTVLCFQIISNSRLNQLDKLDAAEINHIKYGLFSVNQWKEKLLVIITEEINKLELTNKNEKQIKTMLERQLAVLIDKVYLKVRESNKGWFKQRMMDAFVDPETIKQGIPGYADAMILEMKKAQTEEKLKGAVKKRIREYFDKTFEIQDLTRVNDIVTKTGASDIETARVKLDEKIAASTDRLYLQSWILIGLSIFLFFICAFSSRGKIRPPFYILIILMLFLLLLSGVATPMIDMEAKISEMTFILLEHLISFKNQVLYFQSKSIVDVFWIMITHHELQMKIVGVLMVCFSIIFPLLKMFASFLYFYNYRNAVEKKWVNLLVFKSGKWSMTDVLVVAIFMAYIGFNGIISSQFGNFETKSEDMVILTTNGTSLQPGFYLFFTYTVLALFLSGLLKRDGGPAEQPVVQPAVQPDAKEVSDAKIEA